MQKVPNGLRIDEGVITLRNCDCNEGLGDAEIFIIAFSQIFSVF